MGKKKEMSKVEANPYHLKKLANDQRGVRPPVVNEAARLGFFREFAVAQRNDPRIPDEIHWNRVRLERNERRMLDWMAFQEGQ